MRSLSSLIDLGWWRQVHWFAPWRVALTLLIVATIWGLVDVRRRGFAYPETPGEHKSDLTVYTEAGAAFFDGREPYQVCNPRGWTYVYPPMLAMVLAPLHVLPMQEQAIVWFFVCLGMCWGAYRECARIVAAVGQHDQCNSRQIGLSTPPIKSASRLVLWLGVIALLTAFLPTLNCLQRGQVTIVIFYFLLLGTRLVLTGRTPLAQLLGGIVLAVPVVIKIVPILPVAFVLFLQVAGVLRNRRREEIVGGNSFRLFVERNSFRLFVERTLFRLFAKQHRERNEFRSTTLGQFAASSTGFALGLVLFFLLLPATLVGWSANLRHLDTWSSLVLASAESSSATPGFEKDTHSVRNQCLGNAMYRLGNFGAYTWAGGPEDPLVDDANPPPRLMDSPSVDPCLLVVRVALMATLLLVGVRLAGHRDAGLSQAAGFGLACTALLVVSPVARNHYFILLAPGVLFVPLWLADRGRRRAAMVLAVVPGLLILLQYLLLPYVGRVGLLGLGTTAWLMAAMVLIVRAEQCDAVPADKVNRRGAPLSALLGRAA